MQGRVGKSLDSCYGFWVGAALQILVGKNIVNPQIEQFIMSCYKDASKSFSKYMESRSGDPIHTFHSVTALKIARRELGDLSLTQLLRGRLN